MITKRSEGYIFQGAISLHINKVQNYNCLYWKQDRGGASIMILKGTYTIILKY